MNGVLLAPKYVLLDTSQYVRAFQAWKYGKGAAQRMFMDAVADFRVRPVFLVEHLVEFLAHEDDSEIHERVDFLKQFPPVASFKNRAGSGLGTVTDLWEAEIEHIIYFDVAPPKRLISDVIVESICLGEMFGDWADTGVFVDEARRHTLQSRLDTSVVRMPALVDENETVLNFFSRARRQESDRDRQIASIAALAEVSATHLGDKRITDPVAVGSWFFRELHSMKSEIGHRDIYEFALESQGIPRSAINSETTMKEFSRLGSIGLLAGVLSKRTNLDRDSIFWCLRGHKSRCITINYEIESHRDVTQRSTGGAIWDRNFISCSPYVDVVFADKNAVDLVRKAQRSELFKNAVGKVHRAKDLDDVLSDIG